MIRPVDAPNFTEPASKAVSVGVRTDGGAGERASAESMEQSAIAVRQAAVVALGAGTRRAAENDVDPAALYSRPPPVPPPEPRADAHGESTVEARPISEDDARYLRRADGVYYAVTGEVLVDTTPIKGDPEATLHKLMQMREAVLSPPTSPADLQIAARAALDIQRAQLELARERYARDTVVADSSSAAAVSAEAHATDVTA